MTDLLLSASEVAAVRRVLMIEEPVYEDRLRALLTAMHRLVASDCLGVGVADRHGFCEMHVDLPDHVYKDLGPQVCDGPLHTGVEHVVGSPYARSEIPTMVALGIRDCLRVGFPLGGGRVAQIYFDRHRRYFEPRDVQMVSMLQPAIGRLVRPPDRPVELARLSGSERQVLHLVAQGATNQDVADQLSLSEATVRKHLEHVYRKLGVTNRTAASALVRAGVHP